ncbi:hypothetical protein Vadar_022538 [Vaccinium darrowii]|uniref:Uncharacterized protein n=1 Tax=Vaccinium darrowii TaxID=229202 RepID=A0ACB7XT24_9ERIC|nr:hypothetical protein Vadar_022538 [Vaccinium darrowii]
MNDFPRIDIFVCIADLDIEPPMMVINMVLSVMAYDYLPEKIAVYLPFWRQWIISHLLCFVGGFSLFTTLDHILQEGFRQRLATGNSALTKNEVYSSSLRLLGEVEFHGLDGYGGLCMLELAASTREIHYAA